MDPPELGEPAGGWPEPFRSRALAGREPRLDTAPLAPAELERLRSEPRTTLNELLFPGPSRDFEELRSSFGDVSVLPTVDYFYGLRQGAEHVIDLVPTSSSPGDRRGLCPRRPTTSLGRQAIDLVYGMHSKSRD